ncbi:ERAD-associated E3 ubiquitin-protein ligase hrd1 [Wickerhamomyces ciferrii]|uniref:ERAD-associated E3 ubiquitin-protein ligase hrd1 n=1 Tax=Wickerhamomyces ciferrii (strain ATCC 14091 / BCRC 22168 / CBS 111 / JCM 3599 / NBRC 0793 / NRRL Y-1031 F-60-10) TaxID=1206466 RepID=K0KFD8_WICCF|nr:ERAD-associated E3 ubiquitin-protein ligase hrd1 [Wickerhamomyces ciferrii]CCH41656.1 ERAD-associated E3 ubiquitin-protein ligase hrd1 [Wickerhamomyces ciferrii]
MVTVPILFTILIYLGITSNFTTALPIVLTQKEYFELHGYKPNGSFQEFMDEFTINDPYLEYHFDNVTNVSMISQTEIPGYNPPRPSRVYKNPKAPFATHQKVGLGIACLLGVFIICGCILGHMKMITAYRSEMYFINAECFVNEYTRWDITRRKYFSFPFAVICGLGIILFIPYVVLATVMIPVLLISLIIGGRAKAAIVFCKFLRGIGLDLTLVEMQNFSDLVSGKKKDHIIDEEAIELEKLRNSNVITRKQIEEYPISPLSPFNNAHDYLVPREGFIDSKTYKKVIADDDQKVKSESCAICIDEFEDNSKMYILPCQHYFHASCLAQERKVNMRDALRCPLCKLNLLRYYIYYKEHGLNPKYSKFDNTKEVDHTAETPDDT